MESTQERLYDLEDKLLPNETQMKKGLGDLKEIGSKRVKLAFSKSIIDRFDKMTIDDEYDWIARVKNKPQSFDSYVKSNPNKLYEERKTLYIQALDKSISPKFLEKCKEFCEAFYYGLPVKILKNIDISELNVKTRGKGKSIQYHALQILRNAKRLVPKDAYGMICILNKDLYHREDWNFVYGYADFKSRVGVFSFARYNPTFDGSESMPEEEVEQVTKFRAARVM